MSKQIFLQDETYRKFKAALMLTGEDEEVVLNQLVSKYANAVFEQAVENTAAEQTKANQYSSVTGKEQKQLFVNWFRSLTRNGKAYNPVTISGYTGRIENACSDPIFESIPVKNLFEITELAEFIQIQKQIKKCAGYAEFDARSHNGFTAALRKYEEFLRYRAGGGTTQSATLTPRQYVSSGNVHRWTLEEDTICCRRFLECYVLQKSNMDTAQFLQMLSKEVPDVSEGSLRMKIQNIKYLAEQAGLKNTCTIKWLSQYSMQCAKAFRQVMQELNVHA